MPLLTWWVTITTSAAHLSKGRTACRNTRTNRREHGAEGSSSTAELATSRSRCDLARGPDADVDHLAQVDPRNIIEGANRDTGRSMG